MQSVSISRSSSKNWSGVSRSSSSSFVGAQESRDDIESYLSMFKGREGKREAGHAVDWGKLLDGREVLESMEGLQGRVREEGEQEGVEEDYYEEAASMFLKPNPKYLPSPKHPQEKYADTRYCDGAESRKTVHNHMESHAHHSSRRGLGVNVTTISSHLNTYLDLEPGEENISTSTASSIEHKSLHENGKQFEGLVPKTAQNSDGRLLESTHSDESVRVGVRKSGSAATTSQCSRQSIELSSTQSVSGESESESSLSGIFKNNIFSLDQLEAPVQPSVSELSPSNTSTNSATEEEDNNWGSHLPYKLCSPTELESPTVGRNARGGQEGADDDEKTEVRAVVTGTSQEHRPGAHESDRESSSSEDNDRPRETDPKSEDDSEVLSYEEDFESSTVTESDQESGTDISSASGAQEERGETTSGEKSTEEFGDHESSTHEREQERHSVAQQAASGAAEHVTASSEASDVGGGAEIATHREVCREHDDKSGLHKGRAKHSEASKQEGMMGICIS